jgi:two-component system chemotaxis sensor kinase CheA
MKKKVEAKKTKKVKADKARGRLQVFVSEVEELIELIAKNLLLLEDEFKRGEINPDTLNNLFRATHSIKGLAGMHGYENLSLLAHGLEDLFDRLRMGRIELNQKLIEVFWGGVGLLKSIIGKKDDKEVEKKVGVFLDKIIILIKVFSVAPSLESTLESLGLSLDRDILKQLTEYEEHRLLENIKTGKNIFKVGVIFDIASFDQDLTELNKILKQVGEIITTLPSSGGAGEDKICFDIIIGTQGDKDFIQAFIEEKMPKKNITVAKVEKGQPAESKSASEVKTEPVEWTEFRVPGESLKSVGSTVRVEIAKVKEIINMVRGLGLPEKTKAIEERLIGLKIVPIRGLFERFAREVRQIARETKKEIDLEMCGADTELDKEIMEDLAEPLSQIMNDSIMEIEPSEERQKAGKPTRGKITINAFCQGSRVFIEIENDGSGPEIIEHDSIREKIIAMGGLINVEIFPGKGAQFLLNLPQIKPPQ